MRRSPTFTPISDCIAPAHRKDDSSEAANPGGTGSEIPTLGFFDIGSDVLMSVDLNGTATPDVLTYDTDDSQPPAGGTTPISMAAPSVAVSPWNVPETGSLALFGGLLLPGAVMLMRRRK